MADYSVGELAERVDGRVEGDETIRIQGVATLSSASSRQITFFANPRYAEQLRHTRAGAVLLKESDLPSCPVTAVVCSDPYLAYARVANLFSPSSDERQGVHPSAWVSESACVEPSAWIGPQSVVEAGAVVEAGCRIGPGCVVGEHSVIGASTHLIGNVSVCQGVRIGRRCVLHPGVVVGSDGFGFARQGEAWVKVPQLGGVVIGNDVEIGANTTIDRGALEDTVIEDGVKLDNQIQIAHNVHIGAHTVIAGCAGISGSTRIGRRCAIAGGVGIAGHLEIADDVTITAMSLVIKSIKRPGIYSSGIPVAENYHWNRNLVHLRNLEKLVARFKEMERQLHGENEPQED